MGSVTSSIPVKQFVPAPLVLEKKPTSLYFGEESVEATATQRINSLLEHLTRETFSIKSDSLRFEPRPDAQHCVYQVATVETYQANKTPAPGTKRPTYTLEEQFTLKQTASGKPDYWILEKSDHSESLRIDLSEDSPTYTVTYQSPKGGTLTWTGNKDNDSQSTNALCQKTKEVFKALFAERDKEFAYYINGWFKGGFPQSKVEQHRLTSRISVSSFGPSRVI